MLTAFYQQLLPLAGVPGSNKIVIGAFRDDITYVKVQAMKKLKPQSVSTPTPLDHASDNFTRGSFCGARNYSCDVSVNSVGILLVLDFPQGAHTNEGDCHDPDVMQKFYGPTHKDVLE